MEGCTGGTQWCSRTRRMCGNGRSLPGMRTEIASPCTMRRWGVPFRRMRRISRFAVSPPCSPLIRLRRPCKACSATLACITTQIACIFSRCLPGSGSFPCCSSGFLLPSAAFSRSCRARSSRGFPLLQRCLKEQAPVFLTRTQPISLQGEQASGEPWYYTAFPLVEQEEVKGFLCVGKCKRTSGGCRAVQHADSLYPA